MHVSDNLESQEDRLEGPHTGNGDLSELLWDLDEDDDDLPNPKRPRFGRPVFSPESSSTKWNSESSDGVDILSLACNSWNDANLRVCEDCKCDI